MIKTIFTTHIELSIVNKRPGGCSLGNVVQVGGDLKKVTVDILDNYYTSTYHGSIKLAWVKTKEEESNVHANRLEEGMVVTGGSNDDDGESYHDSAEKYLQI